MEKICTSSVQFPCGSATNFMCPSREFIKDVTLVIYVS